MKRKLRYGQWTIWNSLKAPSVLFYFPRFSLHNTLVTQMREKASKNLGHLQKFYRDTVSEGVVSRFNQPVFTTVDVPASMTGKHEEQVDTEEGRPSKLVRYI